jgi:hypothetical protein
VVHYGLPESWPAATNSIVSPPLIGAALGQLNFTSGKANREKVEPDATTLALPAAGAALGNGSEIWIVDTGNNRVLSFAQDLTAELFVGESPGGASRFSISPAEPDRRPGGEFREFWRRSRF